MCLYRILKILPQYLIQNYFVRKSLLLEQCFREKGGVCFAGMANLCVKKSFLLLSHGVAYTLHLLGPLLIYPPLNEILGRQRNSKILAVK